MRRARGERSRVEFGDFQTPPGLAAAVCRRLAARGLAPGSLVEPTCGVGNLLLAALDAFPGVERACGLDVNPEHIAAARAGVAARGWAGRTTLERASFFEVDWPARLAGLPEPILCVGNPPWVTCAALGALQSPNIPEKTNLHGRPGIDAITGKSNFDISEWMLRAMLTALAGRRATVAMLCKTAVARKVLAFAWGSGLDVASAELVRIDSALHFEASVDAGLLVCELGVSGERRSCAVFAGLEARAPAGAFGYRDGALVADTALYDRRSALLGDCPHPRWRSGVKHDCAAVMELRRVDGAFVNGDGEAVELEPRFVFPLLKSSDLARDGALAPRRWMIVPQTFVGEETAQIQRTARNTWDYLKKHGDRLERRASSIYRGRPAFSVFGVGDYTFAPWKVAISGLYKRIEFKVVGPHAGRPVVLDDTCYFLACASSAEAGLLARLLGSAEAREFFAAFVFWDAKRPITAELLRRLDLRRLAAVLGAEQEFAALSRAC